MRAACRKGKLGPRRRAACGPGFPGRPGRAEGAASGEPRTRRRYGTRGRAGSGRDSGPTTVPGVAGSLTSVRAGLGGRRRAPVARRVTAARLRRPSDGTCASVRSRAAGAAVGIKSVGAGVPPEAPAIAGAHTPASPHRFSFAFKGSKRIDTPRPRSGCPRWRGRRYKRPHRVP